MPNSRLSPRVPFFAEVDVLAPGDELPRRIWAQDLSERGAFLQTTAPLRPGARLSLRFDLDDAEVHVRAAEVAWVRPFEPINVGGELPGVGIRFLSVDPPSRAAIRRFVRRSEGTISSTASSPRAGAPETLGTSRTSRTSARSKEPMVKADSLIPLPERLSFLDDAPPPAPPPMPEDADSLELSPLTMPPLTMPPISLPPFSLLPESVPPTTVSSASVQHDATVVSLPPFEQAAHGEHEDHGEMAAPVEASPRAEAHPLAGWRFEVVPEHDEVISAEALLDEAQPEEATSFSGPHLLGALVEEEPAARLGLSFDDTPPETMVLPPRSASQARKEPAEIFSTPPALLEAEAPSFARPARDASVLLEDQVAILELPRAEPRAKTQRKASALGGYGWAVGLLAAGGVAGLVVGWAPGRSEERTAEARPVETAAASATSTETATKPKPVFVAEQELLQPANEAPKAAPVTAPEKPEAKAAAPTVDAPEVVATSSAPAPQAEKAGAALEQEKASQPHEETQLANALPRPTEADAPAQLRVEWGRVTLPLEGGRINRTFTLANPPRVVVDLVEARYPGARNDEIREKGIARLRIGRPDPTHVRVVVELEGDREPKAPSVLKRAGSLAIAWR